MSAEQVERAAQELRDVLARYGDRDPDPEGGSVSQLTIAARALLDAIGNRPARRPYDPELPCPGCEDNENAPHASGCPNIPVRSV